MAPGSYRPLVEGNHVQQKSLFISGMGWVLGTLNEFPSDFASGWGCGLLLGGPRLPPGGGVDTRGGDDIGT